MLRQKLFTVCAIGPIRLLALASYRSLTNQIILFGILDLNFQSELKQYAGSSLASSVLLCGPDTKHMLHQKRKKPERCAAARRNKAMTSAIAISTPCNVCLLLPLSTPFKLIFVLDAADTYFSIVSRVFPVLFETSLCY